jgi:hypothetical protein
VEDAPQSREALEGPEFEEFVQQEVTGSLPPARARVRNASSASNAARGPAAAPSLAANGDAVVTARRSRSGVVAERSMSTYCAAVRPMRSRTW